MFDSAGLIPSHIFKIYDDGQLSIFRDESEKIAPCLFKEQREGQTYMYYEEILEELGLNAKSMAKPSCFDKYQIFKAIRIKEITVRSSLFICMLLPFISFLYI